MKRTLDEYSLAPEYLEENVIRNEFSVAKGDDVIGRLAIIRLEKGDPLPAKVLPGPLNPLGEYALYLSEPSYLIHGANKPASVGLMATNGCLRLYPEDVKRHYETLRLKPRSTSLTSSTSSVKAMA